MKNGTESIVGIALAIVGLAAIAVFVSNSSNTASVFTASGNSFANALRCAMGPILGGGTCGTSVTSSITFGNPVTG